VQMLKVETFLFEILEMHLIYIVVSQHSEFLRMNKMLITVIYFRYKAAGR